MLINTLSTPGIVTYHITPVVGSCAGSAVNFVVTVNPGDSVSISISTPADSVCEGTQVAFTATPVNGGSSPSYQWKVNGIDAGTDSPTFSYNPSNADIVTCILASSNMICITNDPATSNAITLTVNPILPSHCLNISLTKPILRRILDNLHGYDQQIPGPLLFTSGK